MLSLRSLPRAAVWLSSWWSLCGESRSGHHWCEPRGNWSCWLSPPQLCLWRGGRAPLPVSSCSPWSAPLFCWRWDGGCFPGTKISGLWPSLCRPSHCRWYPAYDCCVISKFADGVGAVGGHAVIYEQEVQERTEHAALGGAGVECVMEIHREIWNNDILRPELPLSPFNGNLCRVYTTSWVLKTELAAHSKSQDLYQEVFS